jgi:hypothetical protein
MQGYGVNNQAIHLILSGLLLLLSSCAPKAIQLSGGYSLQAVAFHRGVVLANKVQEQVIGPDIIHFNQCKGIIYGQRVNKKENDKIEFFIVDTRTGLVELFDERSSKTPGFVELLNKLTGKQIRNTWEDLLYTFWDFRIGDKNEKLLWQSK